MNSRQARPYALHAGEGFELAGGGFVAGFEAQGELRGSPPGSG
jgi:hypothetical protein